MIVLIWASTMLLKISCSRLLRLWKGLQSVMLKLFSKLFKKLKLLKFSVKGHDNFELTWPKSYYQWLIKYWKVLCWISSKIWKKSMTALWFQLNFVYCLFKFFFVLIQWLCLFLFVVHKSFLYLLWKQQWRKCWYSPSLSLDGGQNSNKNLKQIAIHF